MKIITFRNVDLERWLRAAASNTAGDAENGPDENCSPQTSWEASTSELPDELRRMPELKGMNCIQIDLRTGDLSAWSIDVTGDQDGDDDEEEDDSTGTPV